MNDAVMQQLLPLHLVLIAVSQSEVSGRSFCYHSTIIPKQQHTSRSKNLTPLSALFQRSRNLTLDLSPKAACSPPGVNYKSFSPGAWVGRESALILILHFSLKDHL